MRITVIDTGGNTGRWSPPDRRQSEVHVRQLPGSDISGCGSSGAPCRQIQYALGEAEANAKTVVKATGGTTPDSTSAADLGRGGLQRRLPDPGPTSTVSASSVGTLYSAIRADNVNAPTTISGFTAAGPTLPRGRGAAPRRSWSERSSNLTLTGLTVNEGRVRPRAAWCARLVVRHRPNSTIDSGTTLGDGRDANSAYGVRGRGIDSTVNGGSITAGDGVASPNSTGAKPRRRPRRGDRRQPKPRTPPGPPGSRQQRLRVGFGDARSGAGGRGGSRVAVGGNSAVAAAGPAAAAAAGTRAAAAASLGVGVQARCGRGGDSPGGRGGGGGGGTPETRLDSEARSARRGLLSRCGAGGGTGATLPTPDAGGGRGGRDGEVSASASRWWRWRWWCGRGCAGLGRTAAPGVSGGGSFGIYASGFPAPA